MKKTSSNRGSALAQISKEDNQDIVDAFVNPQTLLQIGEQISVDEQEKSKQKTKAFTYSEAELDENKECESVYSDVSDE